MAGRSVVIMISALAVMAPTMAKAAEESGPRGAVAAIEFEIVVTRADRPVVDLVRAEVDVLQEGKEQALESFRATDAPGHYAIRYVPDSGKPGLLTVRIRRGGTQVHGPNGGDLEPHVVRSLSPLEATLVALLERGEAADLDCPTAALHFDWGPEGLRHVFAAEVPLAQLKFDGMVARVQILARIRGPRGPASHLTLDRQISVRSPGEIAAERLIWTSSVALAAGRYDVDMLVHDPLAGRHAKRSFVLEVPAVHEGIQMSSVTSLQGRGAYFEGDAEADAALVYEGVALMPKLDPRYERGANAQLRLFSTLYPEPGSAAPVQLRAELWLDGQKLGDLPTVLPKPEPSGEFRWAATMATRALPVGRWQLVLVAQQGSATVTGQASFEVVERLATPPVRLGWGSAPQP